VPAETRYTVLVVRVALAPKALALTSDVRIEESRRDSQRQCHVVEAIGLGVLRQQRRGVDVQLEQASDLVLVFGAIEPVQHHIAWPLVRRRGGIKTAFEPGDLGVDGLLRGLRFTGRWHQPAPKLLDRLFPDGCITGHVFQ
jgi:hypothetical protein